MAKDLTQGSILKSLLTLSIPLILANLLQTAYNLTDTFWVGRLGKEAVASVSISFPIIFLVISLASGLAIAGSILVSQYKGKKDNNRINHTATQTMLMVLIVSAVLSFIGYLLTPFIIRLLTQDPTIYHGAVSYLQISFIGFIFVFGYIAFQSLMRGVGEVKVPMYIILSSVLLNLILDPLFIFGKWFIPSYGVAGAAVATLSTQLLAFVIGLYFLFKGNHDIKLDIKKIKPDFRLIKKLTKLGFPTSIEQSTRALGMTIMVFIVSRFGATVLAAYGIGARIISFIIIPSLAISMSTSTLVGQNIGAKKTERAEKTVKISLVTGFVVLSLVGILFFIFARPISSFFIPGDVETIKLSTLFLRITSLTFGFIAVQMAINGAFRGSGNTLTSMLLSIISLWVLRLPIAYILSNYTSLQSTGIWLAFPSANIISALIAVVWFANGSWKRHNKLII